MLPQVQHKGEPHFIFGKAEYVVQKVHRLLVGKCFGMQLLQRPKRNCVINTKNYNLGQGYELSFRHHASYIQDRSTASPQSTLFIQSTNIFNYFFLDFLSPSLFIPPQNVVHFLTLPFLAHKIFTFYINGVLNCKFPAPGSKG